MQLMVSMKRVELVATVQQSLSAVQQSSGISATAKGDKNTSPVPMRVASHFLKCALKSFSQFLKHLITIWF